MKRLFAKFLKEQGLKIKAMPAAKGIQELTLNFNDWMNAEARKRNYQISESANNFMIRKFIEKMI